MPIMHKYCYQIQGQLAVVDKASVVCLFNIPKLILQSELQETIISGTIVITNNPCSIKNVVLNLQIQDI